MNLKEFCQWSREGWIWAPGENQEAYALRKENFAHINFPLKREVSSSLFDVASKEVCWIEDNNSLLPWQGAVLWEYQENGFRFPVIQIRKNFAKFWTGSYTTEEIVEHELVHAVRFAFKEPLFEEILAYQTSSKKWRRFLGPLFIYPWEASLLLFVSLGSFIYSLIEDSFWGAGVLLILLGLFLLRLFVLQCFFVLCKIKLEKAGCYSQYSLAAMLRLSDGEIIKTALRSSANNLKYFQLRDNQLSRIGVLVHLYFRKSGEKHVYF